MLLVRWHVNHPGTQAHWHLNYADSQARWHVDHVGALACVAYDLKLSNYFTLDFYRNVENYIDMGDINGDSLPSILKIKFSFKI